MDNVQSLQHGRAGSRSYLLKRLGTGTAAIVLFGLAACSPSTTESESASAAAAAPAPAPAIIEPAPAPVENVVKLNDYITGTAAFSIFAKALADTGVAVTLDGAGPFTIFIPSDEAFGKLPDLAAIKADKARLTELVRAHIVEGKVVASLLPAGDSNLTTLGGNVLKAHADTGFTINDVRVINADVITGNGVIHVVESVLPQK